MITPLRKIRLEKGLTALEVAKAVFIDQGHYSRIENGAATSPEVAARLAHFFHSDELTELHVLYPDRYGDEIEAA